MLARLSGTLVDVDPRGNLGLVDPGHGLTYEVLLPAFVTTRLVPREGQALTLHTLHFLEGSSQGTTLFPRIAGFATREDKAFFELFVTVKGIGHRRALRAMVFAPSTLAAAIADRDLKLIQTMPEVGKRLAETIVVTLKGKVDPWIGGAATPSKPIRDALEPDAVATSPSGGTLARDALEVLTQLGEPRTEALQSIERLLSADDAPADVEALIAAVYAARS
ncbi:Holliday junction branch migration protein RuvA [Phycisphaera mikurensis]|uniref:Holliday junction branch migration complex subunit RuvA n=1 Tax=Phycisphaera mikurensis (strain NBRC 102666 / KCTC 22515 / FYK2301M01) TaxID=1142394 RepID=I0ICA8_PHYMF|nr:Holliday junction branch migration protein RuvA [Phycisphaera mikurensis]MBB6441885.1 Holliday junction DNA helicase RuvA [Phycisphaera mikurensis]BAM02896.1 putative Holliday junction ATP-dependent DNA helicase RuvA [Phycisphaera mikurensis NBRC 102666]